MDDVIWPTRADGAHQEAPEQLTAESAGSGPVLTYDEVGGPVAVIIAGGGLDDGRGYARLAAKLTGTNVPRRSRGPA